MWHFVQNYDCKTTPHHFLAGFGTIHAGRYVFHKSETQGQIGKDENRRLDTRKPAIDLQVGCERSLLGRNGTSGNSSWRVQTFQHSGHGWHIRSQWGRWPDPDVTKVWDYEPWGNYQPVQHKYRVTTILWSLVSRENKAKSTPVCPSNMQAWNVSKFSWHKTVLVGQFMEDGALQELFQTIVTMPPEMSSMTQVLQFPWIWLVNEPPPPPPH